MVQMLDNLGFGWAMSLLDYITAAMIPIPFALYRLGPYLRVRSHYVVLKEDLLPQQLRSQSLLRWMGNAPSVVGLI